jgi:hypothetical protein
MTPSHAPRRLPLLLAAFVGLIIAFSSAAVIGYAAAIPAPRAATDCSAFPACRMAVTLAFAVGAVVGWYVLLPLAYVALVLRFQGSSRRQSMGGASA